MPTRLTDLEAVEVSLVDRAANKRRFLMLKRDNPDSSLPPVTAGKNEGEGGLPGLIDGGEMMSNAVLKALLETEAEGEAEALQELLKQEGELSEEALNALRGAMRILSAFRDEIPDEILGRLSKLAGGKVQKQEENEPEAGDSNVKEGQNMQTGATPQEQQEKTLKAAPTPAGPAVPVKKEDGSYDFSGIPQEIRPAIEALWKEHDEAVKKAQQLEATLKAERDERLTKEFVAKAEGYRNLPLDPLEMGPVFKKFAETLPDEWAKMEGLLKAADEQLGESHLFAEFGTSGRQTSGTSWGKVDQMAASLIEKAEGGLTKEQAIAKVLEQNPELYNDYLRETAGVK